MWTGAGYRTNQMLRSPPPPLSPGTLVPLQSPVPYLFGGLAVILAIIAFCLLMLAFSYWKLSQLLQSGGSDSADVKQPAEKMTDFTSANDQFVVIMAGDQKPTFMASRVDTACRCTEKS